MPFLQSGVPDEGRYPDKGVVFESPEVEAPFRRVAKAALCRFTSGRPVLFSRSPECERFVGKGLQPDLPPGRGVGFVKDADFHFVPF